MEWTPVTSSQIKEIGWEADAEKPLGIRFHPGKRAAAEGVPYLEYHYGGITPEMHTAFLGAESKGHWFKVNVKPFPDQFPFVKVV